MRVYVTGGSGFVGAHVVRVFEAHGAELAAPRTPEVDVTDAGPSATASPRSRPTRSCTARS